MKARCAVDKSHKTVLPTSDADPHQRRRWRLHLRNGRAFQSRIPASSWARTYRSSRGVHRAILQYAPAMPAGACFQKALSVSVAQPLRRSTLREHRLPGPSPHEFSWPWWQSRSNVRSPGRQSAPRQQSIDRFRKPPCSLHRNRACPASQERGDGWTETRPDPSVLSSQEFLSTPPIHATPARLRHGLHLHPRTAMPVGSPESFPRRDRYPLYTTLDGAMDVGSRHALQGSAALFSPSARFWGGLRALVLAFRK